VYIKIKTFLLNGFLCISSSVILISLVLLVVFFEIGNDGVIADPTRIAPLQNKVPIITPTLTPTVSNNPVLILGLTHNCDSMIWLIPRAVPKGFK